MRTRRALIAAAAVLIGLAIALVLLEGLVRLLFDEPVQPRFVIDSGYGVRANQPGVRTRHYVPGDYAVAITTNSAGLRGQREYAVAKPPGVLRVLVLGDSFGFGYGVEDDEVVSAALERRLTAELARPVEVVNLSVSGFGQAEELVTWRERGRAYAPDVVVVLYFDNDIGNNAISRLFTITEDGGVARTGNAFLPGVRARERLYAVAPVRWLFEHSEAWNLVRNKLSYVVQQSLLREQQLESFNDASEEGVALTRALMRVLVSEARADGAQAIVFVIPTRRMTSNFPLSAQDVEGMGATLIDGHGFLTTADYYVRDGHWRASGHAKAAERLAPVIAGGAPR